MSYEFDVFVSFASEDLSGFVAPLAFALRRRGLRVYLDRLEFPLVRLREEKEEEREIHQRITRGLDSSRLFVPILSPVYLEKPWPKLELAAILARVQRQSRGQTAFPVLHGMSADAAIRFSEVAGQALSSSQHGVSSAGVDHVADRILSIAEPGIRVVTRSCDGPSRIVVDGGRGELEIVQFDSSGLPFEEERLLFSGDAISAMTDAKEWLLIDDYSVPGSPDELVEFTSTEALDFVQVNRACCTKQDLRSRTLLNFPLGDQDRPVQPFFVSPYFTAGVLNQVVWDKMREWLAYQVDPQGRWCQMVDRGDHIQLRTFERDVPADEQWVPSAT